MYEQPVSLWWLVPGFVLWSNLDNRMFLGLTFLLLWGVGESLGRTFGRATLSVAQRKHFWMILGTCVVGSCLNPFGGKSLFSAFELYGREYPAWRFSVLPHSGPDETGAFSLLTPELWRSGVGRLPLVVQLQDLDEEALVRILTEPQGAIASQYQALFGFQDVDLSFTDEALREVARRARERKTGARGLRAVLEKAMTDLLFELPVEGLKELRFDAAHIDTPMELLESKGLKKSA